MIDKPLGITSFDVLRQLKRITCIKKMWHSWTLDPLASGLLLVAFWNSTKLIPYLEKDKKTYEFELNFTWWTDSYDAETKVHEANREQLQKLSSELNVEYLDLLLQKNFHWKISQIPPSYSAIKQWGKRVVDRIRAWEKVVLKSRSSTIYAIKILKFHFPFFSLQATVSAGTYIRSIAHDFGKLVWSWAYITKLRRTWIWNLNLNDEVQQINEFNLEKTLNQKKVFYNIPEISLNLGQIQTLEYGQELENIKKYKNWIYFHYQGNQVSHVVNIEWNFMKLKRKI